MIWHHTMQEEQSMLDAIHHILTPSVNCLQEQCHQRQVSHWHLCGSHWFWHQWVVNQNSDVKPTGMGWESLNHSMEPAEPQELLTLHLDFATMITYDPSNWSLAFFQLDNGNSPGNLPVLTQSDGLACTTWHKQQHLEGTEEIRFLLHQMQASKAQQSDPTIDSTFLQRKTTQRPQQHNNTPKQALKQALLS